jgi:hypothetical protein
MTDEQPGAVGTPERIAAELDERVFWSIPPSNEMLRRAVRIAAEQLRALSASLAEKEKAKGLAACSWCDWQRIYPVGTIEQDQAIQAMREHVRSCEHAPNSADPASLFIRAVERAEQAESDLAASRAEGARLRQALAEVTDSALAYDAAIHRRGFMGDVQSNAEREHYASGDDLDALYMDWIGKAQKFAALASTPQASETDALVSDGADQAKG